MGTDSGVAPHGRNLRELELMAGLGMAPAAVLEATTRSAAQLLGVDRDLGTIEPGKLADLVLVDGDPAFDTPPERIEGVRLGGAGGIAAFAGAARRPPLPPGAAIRASSLPGIGLSP
jgi:imidazolonepropionase-like amidohydrolase